MEVSFSLGQMFCARVWVTDARDALMSKKATNCHPPNFQENNYGCICQKMTRMEGYKRCSRRRFLSRWKKISSIREEDR